MAVSQEFTQAHISVKSVSYQRLPKNVGDMLLSLSADFSLAEIVTDTSSVYEARYRIGTTPLYLDILGYRSGSVSSSYYLYIRIQHSTDTGYITLQTCSLEVGSNFTGTIYMAYATMGGFLSSLAISTTGTSYTRHGYIHWGWFKSEYTNEYIYVASVVSNASNALSIETVGAGFAPFTTDSGLLVTAVYTYLQGNTATSTITLSSMTYGATATAPTGAVAVFNPQHYIGYISGSKWYGGLLWGGLYRLYILCGTDGAHFIVSPGVTYKIENTSVKALFSNIITPVEP